MPKRGRTAAAAAAAAAATEENDKNTTDDAKDEANKRGRIKEDTNGNSNDDNDDDDDEEEQHEEEEEEEYGSHSMEEEEDDDDDDEEMPISQSFVAWLEEGATSLSVGELHFSNVEHTGSPDAPNTYCVVYELKSVLLLLVPNTVNDDEEEEEDEESPRLFTFADGFPFRVLPASACVGIPLAPVLSMEQAAAAAAAAAAAVHSGDDESSKDDDDDDDEDSIIICTTYALDADIHQSLLEELTKSSGTSEDDTSYTKVSPQWELPAKATDEAVIDGVNTWWKAGEAKTGWDLHKIPKEDYTTTKTLQRNGDKDDGANTNILLDLYRDLCAFQPLTLEDSRDTIEERFEWRTCLCTYFAWAVPNEEALQLLQDLGTPILEIGAGTGYWAWLLSKHRGVDIVAYDMAESHDGHKHRFRHGMVRDGGVEQASSKEHAGRALFLCWPDIVGDSASDDADRGSFGVDTLQAYAGDTVIYVGELGPGVVRAAKGWGDPFPPGGSSASAAFQNELRKQFRLTKTCRLPNWPPYNSHLTIWVRK